MDSMSTSHQIMRTLMTTGPKKTTFSFLVMKTIKSLLREWLRLQIFSTPRLPITMFVLSPPSQCSASLTWVQSRLFYGMTSLTMKAISPIKKGDEVLNTYGALPRSDLLRRYGYVQSDYARYDVVELSTDVII